MAAPYSPPAQFLADLKRQHLGRYRLRWSDRELMWVIEERVGRQKSPHRKITNLDDQAIRYSDGYAFVLGVTAGDRHPCPACGQTVRVPTLQMKWAKCQWCGKEFRACYYPLGSSLLEHLRFIDPFTGGVERVAKKVEAEAELKEYRDRRSHNLDRKSAVWDDWRNLLNIESVGYTGKEFK